MVVDGGELALFIGAGISLLAFIGSAVWVAKACDLLELALIMLALSLCVTVFLTVGGFVSAHNHAETLNATHSLERLGFTVLEVDTDKHRALVVGPGNCPAIIQIKQRVAPTSGSLAYYALQHSVVITSATVRCD